MIHFLTDADKCSPSGRYACDNGGICIINNDSNITCDCPNPFHGEKCEKGEHFVNKRLKILYTKQCVNSILILLIINSTYLDKCSPGGAFLCKNGGMCNYNDTHHEVTCLCPDFYGGEYCEMGELCFKILMNIYKLQFQYIR